jgi:hypothetical protein
VLSAVVFEGGPNWSRIDVGCLHNNPALSGLFADGGERKTIDWGFGFYNDGNGACAKQDVTFQSKFANASLAFGYNKPIYYPNIDLEFLIGGADDTPTAQHGFYFHDYLASWNNPLINLTVIPSAALYD